MEASAVHAPALSRLSLSAPLLRLRSDEQLVALFRAGSEEAFSVIHDRYRQRLFAYARQMLSSASRQDAEDVLQDVFVRAYGALRNDDRDINLRAWLYRVAHNRCIDHLRRPTPPAAEIFEMSRTPLHDPMDTAQRREDLRRLVEDVGRLPEQQRSALLMREIDGMAYADIAAALDVTVPAVKSLLVRARVGLVEAIEARDTDCSLIREDLAAAYDRGVKASGRARKHMRECSGCKDYRESLRGMRKSFAALSPIGAFGPLALAAKALGIGGASGGGAAAAGTAGTVAGTATATATACKVAAVVCATAITAGGAVEVKRLAIDEAPVKRPQPTQSAPQPVAARPATASAAASAPAPLVADAIKAPGAAGAHDLESAAVADAPTAAAEGGSTGGLTDSVATAPAGDPGGTTLPADTGGASAPVDSTTKSTDTTAPAGSGTTTDDSGSGSAQAPTAEESGAAAGEPPPPGEGPPPEH